MRSAPVYAVAVLLCLAIPLVGCGDKSRSPGTGGYSTPESLIQALRTAVLSGDAKTAGALYDRNDPAAKSKIAFWEALAGRSKRWGEVRAAYVAKFGPLTWARPGNPFDVTYAQRDMGLDASLSAYFIEAKAKVEGDRATVDAAPFLITVNRMNGTWRSFREANFGLKADEVAALEEDVDAAKIALEAIAAANEHGEVPQLMKR